MLKRAFQIIIFFEKSVISMLRIQDDADSTVKIALN